MSKNLAYIIGVFLGDGFIRQGRTFGLEVIDADFAEKTKKSLENFLKCNIEVKKLNRTTKAKNVVYNVLAHNVCLCKKLIELTNNRQNLPIDFRKWSKDEQLELVSGLLDSEGYVSMTKVHLYNNHNIFDMHIGIGSTDIWLYELHDFFKSTGVKVGAITRETLKSGKIFAKFCFNKKSFIENGLYFNIFRKQQRIENYKILFPGSTTIRGISKTKETKKLMSDFSKTRQRVGGKFIKIG